MIPVGTLCIIVGEPRFGSSKGPQPLPGRTCEIAAIPGRPGLCIANPVCDIKFRDGEICGVASWKHLRPIAPPGTPVDTPSALELTA